MKKMEKIQEARATEERIFGVGRYEEDADGSRREPAINFEASRLSISSQTRRGQIWAGDPGRMGADGPGILRAE